MKKTLLAALLLLLSLPGAATRTAAIAPGQDLAAPAIANGSFEDVDGTAPRGWKTATFQKPAASFALDTVAHTGAHSVRIASVEGTDAAWTTIARIRPYAKYRLTAWIKTENVAGSGKGALLNLHGLDKLQTTALTGTRAWTKVELVFDSDDNDAVQVNCLLGGWGKATGTA